MNTPELPTWLCKNCEEHVQCWQAPDGMLMADIKTLGMAPVGIRVTDDSVIISDRGTTLELLAKDIERKLTAADKRLLLRTCLPVGVRLRNSELVFEGWFDGILTGIIMIAIASDCDSKRAIDGRRGITETHRGQAATGQGQKQDQAAIVFGYHGAAVGDKLSTDAARQGAAVVCSAASGLALLGAALFVCRELSARITKPQNAPLYRGRCFWLNTLPHRGR